MTSAASLSSRGTSTVGVFRNCRISSFQWKWCVKRKRFNCYAVTKYILQLIPCWFTIDGGPLNRSHYVTLSFLNLLKVLYYSSHNFFLSYNLQHMNNHTKIYIAYLSNTIFNLLVDNIHVSNH